MKMLALFGITLPESDSLELLKTEEVVLKTEEVVLKLQPKDPVKVKRAGK